MTPLLLAIALLQPPAIDRTVTAEDRKAIYAALANNLANPSWYDPALTAAAVAAQGAATPAPAVVWSLASGTLPPGVSLLPDGRLTGTPSAAGTFSFTVRATTLLVGVIERAFTITIQPGVEIDAAPPPVGTVGRAYQFQFATKTQEVLP